MGRQAAANVALDFLAIESTNSARCNISFSRGHHFAQPRKAPLSAFETVQRFAQHVLTRCEDAAGDLRVNALLDVMW
jgi:hypothetical protein